MNPNFESVLSLSLSLSLAVSACVKILFSRRSMSFPDQGRSQKPSGPACALKRTRRLLCLEDDAIQLRRFDENNKITFGVEQTD